jgi:5-methyltetrahydrofolate--homocysteine methyltransferase
MSKEHWTVETILSSATKEVIISDGGPTMLVGERINATGKQKLSAALKAGDMGFIREEALAQVQVGADIIDLNVCIAGYDESVLLPQAVRTIMDTVDIPLCLDSANPKALEAALKIYKGKPLMNSVTGEEHSLETILPLAKEYGAAVIGLVIDNEGISNDPDKRANIACKIVERAVALGIGPENVVIDCLVQSIAADTRAALATIETIRKVRMRLPVNITVGANNSSFGLPDRNLLNGTFIAIAIAAGVTCAIVDVAKMRPIVLAADLFMGRDKYAQRYIEAYRRRQKQ